MRFAAYAGTSVVLAAGTVIRAFFQRANFYSASVQISQSNASLMILTNVALLAVSMAMLGLQRLFYGPLRPIEVEQLYEKAWFAITETCLAMTIFREEIGGWFLVMFVSLLIGKIWGWLGEGRVEILEQQPPANPRLFHLQLSASLLISSLFNFFMLQFSINTVLRHARPNMMVMFAFEFAVLTISSLSTAARYGISVYEAKVIASQAKQRRDQIRRERQEARAQRSSAGQPQQETPEHLPANDDDVDSMDIDTAGWEDKGRWVFYLDLTTDFFKLILYLTFFCVLCMFYGMPIHIIRDVALTIRSFYKRITDFVRYRQATRDMNARYPDATADEVAREDVCIICREDIRPWQPQPDQGRQGADANEDSTGNSPSDERLRPKKLPCGHILHFACLRSWLERQQICPTCRRPVLVPNGNARPQATPAAHPQFRQQLPVNGAPANAPVANAAPQQQNVYQFGPLRIAFGVRHGVPNPQQNNAAAATAPNAATNQQATNSRTRGFFSRQSGQPRSAADFSLTSTSNQLLQLEHQLLREIQDLRIQADQLNVVRALQGELNRLRLLQSTPNQVPIVINPHVPRVYPPGQPIQSTGLVFSNTQPIPSGSSSAVQLPPGMLLPEGWTLLPLRQLTGDVSNSPRESRLPNTQSSTSLVPTQLPAAGAPPEDSGGIIEPAPLSVDSHRSIQNRDVRSSDISGSDNISGHQETEQVLPHADPKPSLQQSQASHGRNAQVPEPPPLPDWVSDSTDSDITANGRHSNGKVLGDETSSSSTDHVLSGTGETEQRNKGKGRAATVEDSKEDADEA